ncbi:cold shock-like protein CspG [Styela clava]
MTLNITFKMSETGTVKWFNEEKGFGFIQRDNGDTDIFVHFRAISDAGLTTLVVDQKVSFSVEQSSKGPQAGHKCETS